MKESENDKKLPSSAMLKRILGLARPEWKPLLVGTIFLLISSAMGLAYPQGIRIIMDEALGSRNTDMVDLAAIGMLAVFAIQGVATAFRSYLFTVTGERIVTQLRKHLFESIVEQEIGFFDDRKTGELTNRLASDTQILQNTVSVNISMALRFGTAALGGVGLLIYTSPQLTSIMLLVVPPVTVGGLYVGRLVRNLSRKSQDALAKAGEVAEETFSGIRTVRTFNREPMEVNSYSEQVEDAFLLSKTRSKAVAIFMGATSFAGYASIAVVLWYGGRLVLDNSMSVGELISFILYTLIVSGALGVLASIYANFMRAAGASERVFSLMERVTSIPRGSGTTLPHPEGKISFQGVHFAYPTRPDISVLQNINLSVSPGERIALVGPSGSGKSTIAALISRLYDPVSGVISLDDVALTELEAGWLREQIGVVSQEPILFSASIAQNIRYARTDATDLEIKEAARIANALEFVEKFPEGMETQVGERGVQLSGGQKQRIAIARAVLKNPKILILDEATSALDTESEYLVKEALERLMQNRTTLVIAHRLSTVQGADRVLVIHHGQVEEEGTHAQLLEQGGMYNRLVERQIVQVA